MAASSKHQHENVKEQQVACSEKQQKDEKCKRQQEAGANTKNSKGSK